jgi:DNA-binding GntR family transcriptional regulator
MVAEHSPVGVLDKQTSKTIIEEVYDGLRAEILDGTLEPESRLRVEELRARFGVSSSTMREALSRLLAEKLVTTEGQRGFFVAPVSLADFCQIAEMRKLLEAEAVRQSIIKGDDDWEARVLTAGHRLSKIEADLKGHEHEIVADWEQRNREFHDALVSGCRNEWLLKTRALLYSHSVRYLRLSLLERTIPRDVHAEHAAILKAALDRDVERAVPLIEKHVDRTIEVLAARLSELDI